MGPRRLLVLSALLGAGGLSGCGAGEARDITVSGRPVTVGRSSMRVHGPARIAAIQDDGPRGTRLVVTDLRTRRHRVAASSNAVRGGEVGLAAAAFSPSGDRVAVTSTHQLQDDRNATVVLIARTGGGHVRRVPGVRLVDADNLALAWTPEGRSLAVPLGSGEGIDLVDAHSGRRRALLRGPARDVAFASNGKAYTFDGPGGIWLGDTRTGTVRRIVDEGTHAVWSGDSRHIAYLSARDHHGSFGVHEASDQPSDEVYVADADGRDQRRMTHTTSDESGPLIWIQDAGVVVYSRFGAYGPTTRALDVQRRCSEPLALPRAELPPQGDLSAWALRGASAAVHLAC
jgi:hypothetical protein